MPKYLVGFFSRRQKFHIQAYLNTHAEVEAFLQSHPKMVVYAAQQSVQRIGDGLCANCGESKTLVVCKECLNELVANR